MSREQRLKILGFSKDVLTIDPFHFPEVGDLLGEPAQASQIAHEAANGLGFGAGERKERRELNEEWIELLFAKVGVLHAQALELSNDALVPETFPLHAGNPAPRIQGFDLSLSSFELFLPGEQGALLDLECIEGSGKAVLFPKHQDGVPTGSFCSDHIPEAYHFLPAGYEAFRASKLVNNAHL